MRVLAEIGMFDDCGTERADFRDSGLNALIARGNDVTARVRRRLRQALDAEPTYFDLRERREIFLLPLNRVKLVSPVRIGDYARVDIEHYTHAAKSSLHLSGAEVRGTEVQPQVGLIIGEPCADGRRGPEVEAARHVFGSVLMLCFRESGTMAFPEPHASVMSPWVTPFDAIDDSHITAALSLTPYRQSEEEMAATPLGGKGDASAALRTLTHDGLPLNTGDLVVARAGVHFRGELSAGDAVRFALSSETSAGSITLGEAGATVIGVINE